MPAPGKILMGAPGPDPFQYRMATRYFVPQMVTTTSRALTTSVDYSDDVSDLKFDSYDLAEDADLESMIIPVSESTSTTTQGPCTGSISLFAQTYLRGQQVTTGNDVTDLSLENFDNLTTSVEVTGTCCWLLYSEKNFKGKSIQLKQGQFKSAADIGLLFREGSSVKNIGRC